jgi:hypothetical protein
VMRLSPAVRLVIRIGSGLLVAAAIAVALTVPAPAFDEQCMLMAPSATSGYQPVYVRSWHLFAAGDFGGGTRRGRQHRAAGSRPAADTRLPPARRSFPMHPMFREEPMPRAGGLVWEFVDGARAPQMRCGYHRPRA